MQHAVAMACAAQLVALALATATAAACETDEDCSLLGTCTATAPQAGGEKHCHCDAGWRGDDCGEADLLPLDPAQGYVNSSAASWGGPSPSPRPPSTRSASRSSQHCARGFQSPAATQADFASRCDLHTATLASRWQRWPESSVLSPSVARASQAARYSRMASIISLRRKSSAGAR